jgi:alpha-tubulin suppressor-like RCC1 family protein
VPGLTDITRIAAGDEHSLALRANGTVLAWGRGDNGQIGDGFKVDALRPLEVISAGGSPLTFIVDVTAGRAHSVLQRDDGLTLTWGRGTEGQLGHGADESLHPTPVDSGNAARVFAAADSTLRVEFGSGTVQGWGDNPQGQLGDGTALPRRAPVATLGLGHEGQQCRDDVVTPGG